MATETPSETIELQVAQDAAKEVKIREQLAELQVQADRMAAARQKLMKQLPAVPVDTHNPATWPWGIMVMAIKEGYYPDRYPLPGERVAIPLRRKVGEVFEIAHPGHFSPFTTSSPMGWMAEPGSQLLAGADPSVPLTTVNNRVLDKMEIAKQVRVNFGGSHKS